MKFCKNMFFGPAGAHQLCDCKLVKLAEITPCSDWSESSLALIGADSFVIQKFCPQPKETCLNFAELFCLFLYQISPLTV